MFDFADYSEVIDTQAKASVGSAFTAGTLIVTPKGEVPVEALRAGDKVLTRDSGLRTIRSTTAVSFGSADLRANPHLGAVRIAAGALGRSGPERDLIVSPSERILLVSDSVFALFEEREVLVAAEDLVGRPGITWAEAGSVQYVSIRLDAHEVILANGSWTESVDPVEEDRAARAAVPARRKLGPDEASMLAA